MTVYKRNRIIYTESSTLKKHSAARRDAALGLCATLTRVQRRALQMWQPRAARTCVGPLTLELPVSASARVPATTTQARWRHGNLVEVIRRLLQAQIGRSVRKVRVESCIRRVTHVGIFCSVLNYTPEQLRSLLLATLPLHVERALRRRWRVRSHSRDHAQGQQGHQLHSAHRILEFGGGFCQFRQQALQSTRLDLPRLANSSAPP